MKIDWLGTVFCLIVLPGCAKVSRIPVFTDFTNLTEVAATVDVPIKEGPMPKDWKSVPFVDENSMLKFTASEARDGFLVYTRPIEDPIYRNTHPLAVERVTELRAFAALGERAQINLAVCAACDLTNLFVSASVPFDAEFRQVTYAPFRHVRYTDKGRYRENPAYLVPVAREGLNGGENRRYVLTLRVPCDAKPGIYRGTVCVEHSSIGMPRTIPYELRVLPFRLERDPGKTYSAYVSHRYDMKRYVEYGHTTLPTLQLLWRKSDDGFFIQDFDRQLSAWRAAGGKEPTRYIALAGGIGMMYGSVMGKPPVKRPQTEMPPDEFFVRLERGLKRFADDWKARGLADVYVIGADEPELSNMAYVTRVFRAIHNAGLKTYVTSWSPCPPVKAALKPYVDVWCDMTFETAQMLAASGKKEHWCYPNHNSFEIKDSQVQSAGGRMTYGFGFWKAADSVLVPWAWSWHGLRDEPNPIPELAGGMQVLKSDGTEWIEWFWEAIYAGMMDEAYVHTLETAIVRRKGTGDPAVCKLVEEASEFLRGVRAAIPFREKYLGANHWRAANFDSVRLCIADHILKLLTSKESSLEKSPSVLPEVAAVDGKRIADAFFSEMDQAGLLLRKAVPPRDFVNVEPGCKVTRVDDRTVKAVIDVDREHGNVNGYRCTSPSIKATFAGGVNYDEYGYVSYKVRVKSNRSADDAARWPHCLLFFAMGEGGEVLHRAMETNTDLAADEWHEVLLPLGGLQFSPSQRRRGMHMLFYFMERDYETGDRLEIEIRDLALVGAKAPLADLFEAYSVRAGSDEISWLVRVFALSKGSVAKGRVTVSSITGELLFTEQVAINSSVQAFRTRLPKVLAPGDYVLGLELSDGKRIYQVRTADFTVVGF